MIELSIIVPTYNEEESVAPLYHAVVDAIEPLAIPFELLFVDDGSRDETFERLEQIAATDPRVVVLKFRRNAGQTAAMAAGIDYARGRFLATMDGDLQNDPADIPMMLEKIKEGYDIVVGWRINRQDKMITRKVPSIVANWLIGKATGLPIRDNGCSLKVYRASMIKRVPLYSDMHRFIPAMTIPLGANVAQVGVRHHARQFGESKYGLTRIYKVLLDLISIKSLLLFSREPITRFSTLGAVTGAAALAVAYWAFLSHAGGTPLVVPMTVAILLGSLSVFLILVGFTIALVHTVAFNEQNSWLHAIRGSPPTDSHDEPISS